MSEITFKELAREWMQQQKRYVKESTYATYLAHMGNHLIPLLGDMECAGITIEVLQNCVLQWLDSGRKDGNGCLSEKTVRDIPDSRKRDDEFSPRLAEPPGFY